MSFHMSICMQMCVWEWDCMWWLTDVFICLHTCMFINICICICLNVYIYVWKCLKVYVCTHLCHYVSICVFMHMSASKNAIICKRMQTYVLQVRLYVCLYMCMHAYIHVRTWEFLCVYVNLLMCVCVKCFYACVYKCVNNAYALGKVHESLYVCIFMVFQLKVIYMYMRIHVHAYMHVHICVLFHMCFYMYVCMWKCMCLC